MAVNPKRIVLAHHRSPGDIVCMSALVRDIHLTYGDEVEIDIDTTCPDLWRHNPYITELWNHKSKKPKALKPGVQFIKLSYGAGIRVQNIETVHFCGYFHRDFKKQTGIEVPMHHPYGDLHLSDAERDVSLVDGRYWVILSGGKSDATVKVWRPDYFQTVVDALTTRGLGVVQAGGNDGGHWHPPLTGVLDLVGQTNLRDLIRLIHHADGVICGVTAAMHIAAALQRPAVVLGGGREAWWWEAYVNENKGFGPTASGNILVPHQYLHTIGMLDCCKHHGCWRNKVTPLNDDKLLCHRPIYLPGQAVAECMNMITPELVLEAVMKYYTDQSLPPLGGVQPPELQEPKLLEVVPSKQACKRGSQHVSARTSVKLPANANIRMSGSPKAKLETRGRSAKHGVAVRPGGTREYASEAAFDNEDVGGKYTVCILFYGGEEFHDLHKRCLESVIATMPAGRMDLRVGSNALNSKSLAMIENYVKKGVIRKHYQHAENVYKYPVMREMFFDPDCPIETKWVLWFDDDSVCDVNPNWASILTQHIVNHHKSNNAHMFGAKFVWTTNPTQREVLSSRPWYKGRPWRMHNDKPSPNGTKILFATGGFWAITHECIKTADIPDLGTGLSHTGGDWQIGEQVYQAGFAIKQFNGSKQFVRTSSVDRRGSTMPLIDTVAKGMTPRPPAQAPATQPPQPAPRNNTRVMEVPPLVSPTATPPPVPPRQPRVVAPPALKLVEL